jgi:hypothetical protein
MFMKGVWKSDLIMATWNVRTMLIPGKIEKVSKEMMMAGTRKENGSGSNATKDDGRKTVYRKKERKTLFEMDG